MPSLRKEHVIGIAVLIVLLIMLYNAVPQDAWANTVSQLPQILIDTLLLGNLYFLIAIGVTMTFSVAKFANFAHGDVATAGAYAAYLLYNFAVINGVVNGFTTPLIVTGLALGGVLAYIGKSKSNNTFLSLGIGILVATLLLIVEAYLFPRNLIIAALEALVVGALISMLSNVLIYKPLSNRGATLVQLMVASIGVALIIRYSLYEMTWYSRQFFHTEIAYQSFGVTLSNYQAWLLNGTLIIAKPSITENANYVPAIEISPHGITFKKLDAFDVLFNFPQPLISFTDLYIWSTVTVIAVVVILTLMFKKTKIGKAWRAVANNPTLAAACGIDIDSVVNLAWLVAGALAGLGGLFWAIQTQIYPELGWMILLNAFAVAVLGGLGSFWGTFIASYILAFAEQFGVTLLASINPQYTGYRFLIPFSVFLLVLYLKPEGLAGLKMRKA